MTGSGIYYLSSADLRLIAGDVAAGFLIRDPGLLESAAARPRTTVFGADAYPGIWDKAAALLHSIAKNHPLVDGNKRLAVAAAAIFLARNGVDIDGLNEDLAYDLMISVASEEVADAADIAEQLGKAFGQAETNTDS
ncbi:type II toxin-antitoxin system death-on-curing family toxin [Nocardia rhamnosiphila]|uniref:type II toxin-antitoxin system death-on-curing family toxin n=1 Tax=Nocardia rhamnosiphila TaxID=426716 RepID=UPI0033C0E653